MDDRRRAAADSEEAELDPNQVAAYVAGRLTPAERAAFEARTGPDPEAQLLIRALREDAPSRRGRVWMFAAAAVLVVLVGAAWFARDRAAPDGTSERLAAAAADLARRSPEIFGSFKPYDAAELDATPPVTRGGAQWISPRGTLLGAPTEFRWQNAPGSEESEISIEGPGGRWQKTFRGVRAMALPLPPGRYIVAIRPIGSLAGQESRASFVVADDATRAAYDRAVGTLRHDAPADLADLLVAHFALRGGFRQEAWNAAVRARAGTEAVRGAADALLRHLREPPAAD